MIICLWSLQEQVDDLIWSLASLSVSFLTTFTLTISTITITISVSGDTNLVFMFHFMLSGHSLTLALIILLIRFILSLHNAEHYFSTPFLIESHISIQAKLQVPRLWDSKQPCWTPKLDYDNWDIDRCERLQKMLLIKGCICCHIINKTWP